MVRAFIDVDFETIKDAYDRIVKKKTICKILPRARIYITENGKTEVGSLVCDNRMGGEQTGVAAEYCTNCKKKK